MSKLLLVVAITLLFAAQIVSASDITPIIKAVSPDSLSVNALEGDLVAFDAYIDNPMEQLPLNISWLYDGVYVKNETLISDGAVYYSLVAEAGTHEVMVVVTAIDCTNATHEWRVIVEQPHVTVTGTVFVEDIAVSKAMVRIKDSMGETVAITKTDVNGQYSVELPAGTYMVSAKYKGLKSDVFVVVVNGVDVFQDILLQPKVKA